jgi:long-chain acyl-CoA synthetase
VIEGAVQRIAAVARSRGDRPALITRDGVLSYRELEQRVAECTARLRRQGLASSGRLAVVLGNRPEFVVTVLAGLGLGATVAPLDPLLKTQESEAILADLCPTLVVRDTSVDVGPGPRPATGRPAPAGPAFVLYTSGSTGRPKGALLSHEALAFALDSWAGPVLALQADDVVLGVLPLSHSFGLNGALLAPLLAGAAVSLVERFTPEAVLDSMATHRVTVFPGVATMFHRLLEHPALVTTDLTSLRLAVSGAAPCSWELAEAWRRRTGVRIVRGYGMTELFRPISYLAGDVVDRPAAIGRPVPGVEARIADDEGRPLPPDEVGELWIRSPAAMDGYLEAPEETRAVLRDGWFMTGDLATMDRDGFVRITGRKRDRILRGGHSVFPSEVEAVLLTHPAVAEAAVVGREHPELGEEVAAFVVLSAGAATDPETLIGWCKDRLAGFKYPRDVVILAALPRSATGKVLKARLAAGIVST